MANDRVAQTVVEVLVLPADSKARAAQTVVEVLVLPTDSEARAAQTVVEVLVAERGELQGWDMFDHAIDGSFYNTVLGTPSAVTTPVYSNRPASLLVASAGADVGVRQLISGTPKKGWVGFLLRLETLPTGGSVSVGALADSAGTRARVYVTTGGVLTGIVGAGTPQAGPTLEPDIWYWVEMIYDANDGTGVKKLIWRVDNAAQTNATLTEAASTIASVDQASYSGEGTVDWYSGGWWWGSAARTTEFVGRIPRWFSHNPVK